MTPLEHAANEVSQEIMRQEARARREGREEVAWDEKTIARAALAAIREPSEGMVDAGMGVADEGRAEISVWQAMIDAALADD